MSDNGSSVVPERESSRERAWKRTERTILFFLSAIAFVFWILDIGSFIGGAWNPANLSQACQAIIQFDSFITAGWTAGFFYFWGSVTRESNTLKEEDYSERQAMSSTLRLLEKGVKELGTVIASIPGSVPENIRKLQEKNEKLIQADLESAPREDERMDTLFLNIQSRTNSLFYYAIGTFATFVGAALIAIVGILIPDRNLVLSSLALLVIGILLTVVEWMNLHAFGTKLSQTRIAMASLTKETDSLKEQIEDIRKETEEIKQDALKLQHPTTSSVEKGGPMP